MEKETGLLVGENVGTIVGKLLGLIEGDSVGRVITNGFSCEGEYNCVSLLTQSDGEQIQHCKSLLVPLVVPLYMALSISLKYNEAFRPTREVGSTLVVVSIVVPCDAQGTVDRAKRK